MKNKLLARNTYTSLLYQVVTVACGFVLPKLILVHYGTAVNGLVNSITQLFGINYIFGFGNKRCGAIGVI